MAARLIGRGTASWADHAVAAEAWEHQHEAEWTRVDQKLRGIASRRAALDAEEANLLRYAEELKLWRGWGFGSMLEYMERAMGYAPHTATERLRVARAIAELPLIADALEHGALAHSAVRELSRVAVPDTEAVWLEAASGKSLREIEAMVSGHKPGDLPTDETEPRLHRKKLMLEVSSETYDIWRKLHALAAEEHGQRLSDDELIQSLFRRAYGDCTGGRSGDCTGGRSGDCTGGRSGDCTGGRSGDCAGGRSGDCAGGRSGDCAGGRGDCTGGRSGDCAGGRSGDCADGDSARGRSSGGSSGNGASSPAYKLAIKQCPDCKRAWQYSGGRDIEIDPAVAECAACDAVHLGSLDAAAPERVTTTVTPRKREQVLARDGYCCTVPGCRRTVGLDLHHIEYQSRGGDHELRNLTTLCDLHHRAVHFGKLVIHGTAPDHIIFEFRKPRDRRNATDDDSSTPPSPRASLSVVPPSPARVERPASASTSSTAPTWAPAPRRHAAVAPPALDAATEPRSPSLSAPAGQPHAGAAPGQDAAQDRAQTAAQTARPALSHAGAAPDRSTA
jgi:hypothetical protein